MPGCVPSETIERNEAHAKTLGLPRPKASGPRLAVVGGSPSLGAHLEELRSFDGEIWGIGSTFGFLRGKGIESTFFYVDPTPFTPSVVPLDGVKKAVLASCVDRTIFDVLKDAEVSVFDLVTESDLCNHGPTTATAAPELAITAGYRDITFYGCEGSYEDSTHLYKSDREHTQYTMQVKCDGRYFLTSPEFLVQTEFLATMIRLCPAFKEKSGGLLGAMVRDINYDITAATQELHNILSYQE